MSRIRIALLGLALVAVAAAQPSFSTGPRSVYAQALVYLADPGLLKEIGADDATAKKLDEHRGEWYRKYATASLENRNDEAKLRAFYQDHEKALAQVLKPDQMTRLRQVMLQQYAQGRIRFGTLADMVEAADVLKLDDKQRAAFRDGTAQDKVLTDAQQAALKDLLGKPYDGVLVQTRPPLDPANPFNPANPPTFAPRVPAGTTTAVYAATEAHIQTELKLETRQKKAADEAAKKYQTALRETRTLKGDDLKRKTDELRANADAALKETFTADQMKRLEQIVRQRARGSDGLVAYLRQDATAETLRLRPEQRNQFEAVTQETAKALRTAVLSGEPADKVAARVAELGQAHEKSLLDVLTPEQRAKWDATFGAPFKDAPARSLPWGPGAVPGGGPGAAGFGQPAAAQPPAAQPPVAQPRPGFGDMGTLATTYTLVTNAEVQKALKMTPDQVTKLAGVGVGFANRPTNESLANVLTDEQITRLEQLTLQQRQQIAGPAYLFRFSAVAHAIGLTEEQRKQLDPTFRAAVTTYLQRTPYPADKLKEDTAALMKILTAEQQTKWKALLGEAHVGPLADDRSPRASFPTTRDASLLPWLAEPDVQRDLLLTADQVAKVSDTQAKLTTTLNAIPRTPAAERREKTAAANKQADDALAAVLQPKQKDRLAQLRLRQTARDSGLYALTTAEPRVAEALGLSGDDLNQIRAAEADARRVENLIQTDVARIVGAANSAEAAKTVVELRAAYKEQAAAALKKLLTPDRDAKLQELLGKPYDGKFPASRSPWGGLGGAGGFPPADPER